MVALTRIGLLALTALVTTAALAYACNPQAHISLDKATYEAGSTINVYGSYFVANASVTVSGPFDSKVVQTSAQGTFTTQLTAPAVPGNYTITASRPTGGFAPASFSVVAASATAPAPAPPTPAEPTVPSPTLAPDLAGPEILRPARARETVTVARDGSLRIFCGRFAESGVTGTCGLASRRNTRDGYEPLLVIAAKAFRAQAGRRVDVAFQLSPVKLRRLRVAGRLRMGARVVANDVLGNRSTLAFGVTLAAPRPRRPS